MIKNVSSRLFITRVLCWRSVLAEECRSLAVCERTDDQALPALQLPLEDLSAGYWPGIGSFPALFLPPMTGDWRPKQSSGKLIAGDYYHRAGERHVGKKLSIGKYDEFCTKEVFKNNNFTIRSENCPFLMIKCLKKLEWCSCLKKEISKIRQKK